MMYNLCIKLKVKLEQTFSMPFDVKKVIVDGEEQYVCCPQNKDEVYFTVTVYIHNQIRLVVYAEPQKNAIGILSDIAMTDESKKQLFFKYIDILRHENAKVNFSVNGESLTDSNSWPKVWRYFSCKMTLIPIPELLDEEEIYSFLSTWMIHGTTLIMSLLTVEELDNRTDVVLRQEGRGKEIKSIKYERSRINRSICLAHKGYSCYVCGFNFLEKYGLIGKDYIEVHHTTPVSKMSDDYVLDIDRDLVPVCSNCHSMIHRKDPPFTIEEIKSMMTHGESQIELKHRHPKGNRTIIQQLCPQGSIIESIEKDNDVRVLIHNMMELHEGTTIMKIVVECQKQFQERYFSMKPNDWRHLIRDYVRTVTERPDLQETEIFRLASA